MKIFMSDNIVNIVKDHARRYGMMTAKDAAKLVYQNVFGCAHIMGNPDWKKYLADEYESVTADITAQSDHIGNGRCRMPLAKAKGLNIGNDLLEKICILSAERGGESGDYTEKMEELIEAAKLGELPFEQDELESFAKMTEPCSHSESYRSAYKPSYRVAESKIYLILPVLAAIEKRLENGQRTIVAIDGSAAAGKSTAAAVISRVFPCSLIHMDDFFLPFDLRTPERLCEPGGNVHYERFFDEVVKKLGSRFSYRVFDCSSGDYNGENVVDNELLTVVEGSYSLHPYFGDYADIKVFMDVSESEQISRILARSGERMLERFKNEWIPMERRYHKAFEIKMNCDIVINQ